MPYRDFLTYLSYINRIKEERFWKKNKKNFFDKPTHYRTLAALGASVLLPSGTTRGRCILQKILNLKAKEISIDKNQTNHALIKKTTTVCFEWDRCLVLVIAKIPTALNPHGSCLAAFVIFKIGATKRYVSADLRTKMISRWRPQIRWILRVSIGERDKLICTPEAESKEKHGVWDPMPELTKTCPYVHSRVDSNTFTMANPTPWWPILWQGRLYPPVRDLGFGLRVWNWRRLSEALYQLIKFVGVASMDTKSSWLAQAESWFHNCLADLPSLKLPSPTSSHGIS